MSCEADEEQADHDLCQLEAGPAFDVSILMNQNFDGSFDASPAICAFIGSTTAALEAAAAGCALLSALDAATRLRFWVTLKFVATLNSKYAANESSWSMVAEKSKTWCLQTLQRSSSLSRPDARKALDSLLASC
jgi:Ser/Thr protein kinase RdoA (MazF antagonist)